MRDRGFRGADDRERSGDLDLGKTRTTVQPVRTQVFPWAPVQPGTEVPPVGRSRWLRGLLGRGLNVLVFPCDGGDVSEGGVPAA